MSGPDIEAARWVLVDVCRILKDHRHDVVLVGGWVPDLLIPEAIPSHEGSMDVDLAIRASTDAFTRVIDVLIKSGYRIGSHPYQLVRELTDQAGRLRSVRLDLLTSGVNLDARLQTAMRGVCPETLPAVDMAFRNQADLAVTPDTTFPVAGLIAFFTMKTAAMADPQRNKPKDAYDIHFCLEKWPFDAPPAASLFAPWTSEAIVIEALHRLRENFATEDSRGPRMVADFEGKMGEMRAQRKLEVSTRVTDFLDEVVRQSKVPE